MVPFALLLAAAAQAQADPPSHLPYAEASPGDLAPAPPGFAIGQPCRVQATMLPDLVRLLDAARAAGLGQELRGASCFRSVARQRAVFCRTHRACADAAERAVSVGPPGRSEHATGYTIDFAARPSPGCPDVSDCFARTAAGTWLLANGARFGFEVSFPAANAQGVAWEPWHWRWVGAAWDEPGADAARAVFARARVSYPASPGAALVAPGPTADQAASLPAVTATLRPR